MCPRRSGALAPSQSQGRVIDENERPVAGAKLSLLRGPDFIDASGWAATYSDGSFEMGGIGVGRFRLRVELPSKSSPRDAVPEARSCEGEEKRIAIAYNDVDVELGTCRIKRGH